MAKRKGTNNDLQNITQKTKNRATWTPLQTGGMGELMYEEFEDTKGVIRDCKSK